MTTLRPHPTRHCDRPMSDRCRPLSGRSRGYTRTPVEARPPVAIDSPQTADHQQKRADRGLFAAAKQRNSRHNVDAQGVCRVHPVNRLQPARHQNRDGHRGHSRIPGVPRRRTVHHSGRPPRRVSQGARGDRCNCVRGDCHRLPRGSEGGRLPRHLRALARHLDAGDRDLRDAAVHAVHRAICTGERAPRVLAQPGFGRSPPHQRRLGRRDRRDGGESPPGGPVHLRGQARRTA